MPGSPSKDNILDSNMVENSECGNNTNQQDTPMEQM